MTRHRMLRLFWPLAIWIAVFGWRTAGCKGRNAESQGRGRRPPTVVYHYPPTPPPPTIRPGFTPIIPRE